MDRSASSVDSCDVDPQTPSETATTRPKPFEDDDASSRKRRRTSASASTSPTPEGSHPHDTETNPPHDIIEKHDTDTALQQGITTPAHHADNVYTPVPADASASLDPSSQLTLSLRRIVGDRHTDALETGQDVLAPRLNSPILGQRTDPGDDRDMAQPCDDTSSSDLEEIITPPHSFPFRLARDDLHEPVIRFIQHLTNGKLLEQPLPGHPILTAKTRSQC